MLTTYTGPQTVTVSDSYAQHYEETRYYRLRITEGTCSRLVGPKVVTTSSGQSSGLAGGLESNGRMASQLARRAIARSTWAEQRPRRGELAVRQAALDTPTPSPLLLRLLPTQGPDGARRVDATPTDLPGLTNAKSVAAADYLDESGQRVASLLLVETQGEVYEHSKMLCDRAGGSVLDRVDEQGMAPSGAFLRTLLRDERHHPESRRWSSRPTRGRMDHSASTRAGCLSCIRGRVRVSEWSMSRPGRSVLGTSWPWPPMSWRRAAPLSRPRSRLPAATSAGPVPWGTARRLVQTTDPGELSLRTTRLLPNGQQTSEQAPLRMQALTARYAPFADVTLELVDSAGLTLDRIWLSDGAWARLDDALWAAGRRCGPFPRRTAAPIPSRSPTGICTCRAALGSVPRSVSSPGWPATGGGFAPLDLSSYQAVSFVMTSSQPLRLCLSRRATPPPPSPASICRPPPGRRRCRFRSAASPRPSPVPRLAGRARDRHLRQPHQRSGRDDDQRSALPAQQRARLVGPACTPAGPRSPAAGCSFQPLPGQPSGLWLGFVVPRPALCRGPSPKPCVGRSLPAFLRRSPPDLAARLRLLAQQRLRLPLTARCKVAAGLNRRVASALRCSRPDGRSAPVLAALRFVAPRSLFFSTRTYGPDRQQQIGAAGKHWKKRRALARVGQTLGALATSIPPGHCRRTWRVQGRSPLPGALTFDEEAPHMIPW